MPDPKELDAHYKTLNHQELLKLRAEGGFTPEAEQVLDKELARRNLTPDEAKRHFAPEWLEQAAVGTLGVVVLDSSERITAEVAGLNETGDRLSVKVIPPDGLPRNGRRHHRAIPLHRIVSFEPQPQLMERWPYSDPCRVGAFSPPRFILMTTIFLGWTAGSLPLFLTLVSRPYGLQEASFISYTLCVVFFTFAETGSISGPNLCPYRFTCPAVETQIPRLLWRHCGFLVALFALQTALLAARPHLPDWWNLRDGKGGTPFDAALPLLCFGLAWAQVLTNRSFLHRAHREFSP
jgi:hypothetical protein